MVNFNKNIKTTRKEIKKDFIVSVCVCESECMKFDTPLNEQ